MNEGQKLEFLKSYGVDIDKGLENMMDIDTYDEILNDFYDNLAEEFKLIQEYKNAGDMPNYAIKVHAMKSNARSFGFMNLGEIAYAHEMASKANDINYVNSNYETLINEIKKVYSIIKKYKEL